MWVTNATRTSAGAIGPGPVTVPYAVAMELLHSGSAHFGDKPWHDCDWTWTKADWAFRASNPAKPDVFRSYSEWWDQEHFNRLWTPEADGIADDLADRYSYAWPWLIWNALTTGSPQTAERIRMYAEDPNRSGPRPFSLESMADSITSWGSFQVVRRRRAWPEPRMVACPICNTDFWNGDLNPWAFKAFGPARYCMSCCKQARNYPTGKNDCPLAPSRQSVIAVLKQFAAEFDIIPGQNFAVQVFPHDAPDGERDSWMRALIAMPEPEVIKEVLAVKDWLSVLKAVGLVQFGWRASRGIWCHATDGHVCRSLLEKTIDDWLTSHGIPHQCEPYWPEHSILNPSGRKRADWLMQDGTYVECAGMMEDPDYATKIARKRELARVLGIPLVVIGPTDLLRLPQIFVNHIVPRDDPDAVGQRDPSADDGPTGPQDGQAGQ